MDYEIMDLFAERKKNPRYIYYTPDPDFVDKWLEESRKQMSHNSVGNFVKSTDSDCSDNNQGTV